jgi:hypothetical protein
MEDEYAKPKLALKIGAESMEELGMLGSGSSWNATPCIQIDPFAKSIPKPSSDRWLEKGVGIPHFYPRCSLL